MVGTLAEFQKKKDFLICVDSDGCVMDTMDIKHIRCFGPCMVKTWGLEQWEAPILQRWNDINLYTLTRGINRFTALAVALQEIDLRYTRIDDLYTLVYWAQKSRVLSNDALRAEIEAKPDSSILKKALEWSQMVNREIKALPMSEKRPFPGVKECLHAIHEFADVAVISSANPGAVRGEWQLYQLEDEVDIICAQDVGSKAFCIGELMKQGYDPEKTIMCGDAPGDREAAAHNDVYFYPILVRNEEACWRELVSEALPRLQAGTFGGHYQKEKVTAFLRNLGG